MAKYTRIALAACTRGLVVPVFAAEEKAPPPEALEKAEATGVFSKMIGGKEWRVEPIAGTKNFKVTWGDDTVTWTPKPWQPKELILTLRYGPLAMELGRLTRSERLTVTDNTIPRDHGCQQNAQSDSHHLGELRQFYRAICLPIGPVPTNRDSGAAKV